MTTAAPLNSTAAAASTGLSTATIGIIAGSAVGGVALLATVVFFVVKATSASAAGGASAAAYSAARAARAAGPYRPV